MSERLIYESKTQKELLEATPNAPTNIAPGTGQDDVVGHAEKLKIARSVISQTLPGMIGFTQPLNGPEGFVYGFKYRSDTIHPTLGAAPGTPGSGVTHTGMPLSNQQPPSDPGDGVVTYPATTKDPADPMTDSDVAGNGGLTPAVPAILTLPVPEDPIVVRKLIKTDVYEVVFDLTNEIIQDIQIMFGEGFPELANKFISNGGEFYGFDTDGTYPEFARFFLPLMYAKAVQKVNDEFATWALAKATNKGTTTITTVDDMVLLHTAIGELKEALYKSTGKSGPVFCLCSPRIASFVSMTLGITMSNHSDMIETGRPVPSGSKAGFVLQAGDITFYEYDFHKDVTGGWADPTTPAPVPGVSTTEMDGVMVVGFAAEAGPNAASVYFSPYKEYLVAGGGDYETGQSNVFFRMRAAWNTNPLDTYDRTIVIPEIDDATTDGKSQFLVRTDVVFLESMIV